MGDIRTRFSLEGEQQYRSAMTNAANAIKVLNAEQKLAAAQFKNTGDAEKYAADKAQILQQKITQQKKAVEAAEAALKELSKNGVSESSKQFQQWQIKLTNAQTALTNMETELGGLTNSMSQTAKGAEQLTTSINGIGKKISLDQVISGIDRITDGLESAAKKAVQAGEAIWDNIMQSAQWGDDIATQAMMAQMSIDEYQRVVNVAATTGETSTSSLIKSWKKVKMNLTSDSADVIDAFNELGIAQEEILSIGKYGTETRARDYMDVYWEIGEALMNMTDAAKQERLAQTLLGRSWQESIPMFKMGREAYEQALHDQDVVSEENVKNLAELNDTVISVQQQFEAFKNTIIGEISPALTAGAKTIGELIGKINDFLATEKGQQLLERLGDAVSGLFDDLSKVDPEQIVENFVGLFETVVEKFEWLFDHKNDVFNALKMIAGGFALLKISSLAANITKIVQGLGGLFGGGNGGSPVTTTTGTGGGGGLTSLLAGSSAVQKLGSAATALSMADPTGLTAFIPQALADKTEFGWRLTHGSTLGEAADASWNTIKASASEGMGNFKKYFTEDLPNAFWGVMGFKNAGEAAEAFSGVMKQTGQNLQTAGDWTFGDDITAEEAMALIKGEPIDVKIEPDADGAAEDIQEQVGTVTIPAKLSVSGFVTGGGGSTGNVFMNLLSDFLGINGAGFANGLPYVPYDGYLSVLHRGERVLTASENRNYTYNSNTYFGSVNLNNGLEIDALTDSIARQNRRQRSGYGT